MDSEEARRRLYQLHIDLKNVIDKDPEQEVRGWAVPVLDAVLQAAKAVFPTDEPAVARLQDVMSPEAIGSGESVQPSTCISSWDNYWRRYPIDRFGYAGPTGSELTGVVSEQQSADSPRDVRKPPACANARQRCSGRSEVVFGGEPQVGEPPATVS